MKSALYRYEYVTCYTCWDWGQLLYMGK